MVIKTPMKWRKQVLLSESQKYLDALNIPEERKSELRKYVANMMKRQN